MRLSSFSVLLYVLNEIISSDRVLYFTWLNFLVTCLGCEKFHAMQYQVQTNSKCSAEFINEMVYHKYIL